MVRDTVTRQCGARGCRRKTKAEYCWQHADMADVARLKWPKDDKKTRQNNAKT